MDLEAALTWKTCNLSLTKKLPCTVSFTKKLLNYVAIFGRFSVPNEQKIIIVEIQSI